MLLVPDVDHSGGPEEGETAADDRRSQTQHHENSIVVEEFDYVEFLVAFCTAAAAKAGNSSR